MADHNFFPCLENLKHSLSLTDIDQAMESHFSQPILNFNRMSFPHENHQFLPYFPDFHGNSENIINGPSPYLVPDTEDHNRHQHVSSDRSSLVHTKKRKSMDPENNSVYSSPQASDSNNGIPRKNSSRRGKKQKNSVEEDEKSREVVHVRAKRGQATDSHSLAERVRRGKINERLKCLQDIVPGCYKTMGMSLMLDEIINYVQSLQNQVEFLSMKLTAASTVYDFNTDMDAIEATQRARAVEALKMQNTQSQGFPISPQFDNFGYLPQFQTIDN